MSTIKATPKMRYHQHKASAKRRGIEFDMTFDEWWAIWEPHFDQRGPMRVDLQMCRNGDDGAYRPGNVHIATGERNMAEAKVSMATRAIRSDWVFDGEDRSELRSWAFNRHKGFRCPLAQLVRAEEEETEEDS
jgi:hypothetical protein